MEAKLCLSKQMRITWNRLENELYLPINLFSILLHFQTYCNLQDYK